MNATAPSSSPTVLERALGGVIACCLASVPLAAGLVIQGYYSSTQEWSVVEVVLGVAVTSLFSMFITVFVSVILGIPAYSLTIRAGRWRIPLLLLSAACSGIVVYEVWTGAALFEDLSITALCAFFGLYSGVAFWIGAEVWQPIRQQEGNVGLMNVLPSETIPIGISVRTDEGGLAWSVRLARK